MKLEPEWLDFWLVFEREWSQFVAALKDARGNTTAQDAKGWNLQTAPGN